MIGGSVNTKGSPLSTAELCRRNGWKPGTILAGDEGYGVTEIVITAIGEHKILAKRLRHNGAPTEQLESVWGLECREWKVVE